MSESWLKRLARLVGLGTEASGEEQPGTNRTGSSPGKKPGTVRAGTSSDRQPGVYCQEALARLTSQQRDYLIYVGVPLARPKQWVRALVSDDALLINGQVTAPEEAKAFVVAYQNGQVVDFYLCGLGLPEGLSYLERPGGPPDSDRLTDADLIAGRQLVHVSYGEGRKPHYSTTVVNVSPYRLQVSKFAAYRPTSGGYKLSTVTGRFFSAGDFKEWYGQAGEWLEPGASATDPNNYGSPPVLWAYYCETEDGKQFVAGEVLR
jgi:hypothetical protein